MLKIILFFIFFLPVVLFAQTITIAGRIQSVNSGELIQGAHIYHEASKSGAISNAYGFFSIKIPLTDIDNKIIRCSMLGYKPSIVTISARKDTTLLISLIPTSAALEEVVVEASRKTAVGSYRLSGRHINLLPTLGGEPDVLKCIQLYPGVVSGNDGVNNLSVRGSNHWQNLILLDEAIVYNPNHALSFFSVFNNDAVKEVAFYKGYQPVNYGGRNASVIDVRMKEGNNKHYQMKGGVGLIASRLSVEGPLIKDKLSFILSGRYGNPGELLSLLDKAGLFNYKQISFGNSTINYYDVNAKISLTANDRNRLYLSLYTSKDHFDASAVVMDYAMKWNNTTGTFRWNSIVNENVNLNTVLCFSNYGYEYRHYSDGKDYLWNSDVKLFNLKEDLAWYLSPKLSVKGGVQGSFFYTLPGKVDRIHENSNINPFSLGRRKSLELSPYAGLDYAFTEHTSLEGGIRLPMFFTLDKEVEPKACYLIPEPRVQLTHKFRNDASVLFAANVASQNMHLMSNSSVGLPSDIWLPANNLLRPMTAYQLSGAYKQLFFKQRLAFEVGVYYKNTRHIADFKDNANLFMNAGIEKELLIGWADAYGAEVYLEFNTPATQANISYTYAYARNHISGINGGNSYRPVYDRPHSLKLFVNQQLNPKWSVSATFALRSGMNLTLPVNSYIYQGVVFYEYSERNGYRAPLYHQMDMMLNYMPVCKNRWKSEWSFGIMNLYNRKNVFSMYAGHDESGLDKGNFCKMYLYGILPSITYNFKF